MFKNLLLFCSFAAILSCGETPPEKAQIDAVIKEFTSLQARSWPSYDWKEAPALIQFKSGTIYGTGLKENKGWEREDRGWKVATFDHWGVGKAPMQPWFPVEGQEGFAYKMGLGKDPIEDVVIFAHERFHRYQAEHFTPIEAGVSEDHLNIEALTWASIEDELYREYLNDSTQEAMRDLAAAITHRRGVLSANSLKWEDHQMRMEGLADYTSTSLFEGKERLLKMHPLKERESGFIDEAIQWRHYLTGATLAYALDELIGPEWKPQVEQGKTLAPLFLEKVNLGKEELALRVKNIKKRKNFDKRGKKMKERVTSYQEEVALLYKNYTQELGVPLLLDHPKAAISGGGSNDKLLFLPEGGTLGVQDSSVAVTDDGHWKFETIDSSHLFQHPTGHREVKLGGFTEVEVDGYLLDLTYETLEPKEFLFTSLQIKSDHATLSSLEYQGVLIVDQRGIQVGYF